MDSISTPVTRRRPLPRIEVIWSSRERWWRIFLTEPGRERHCLGQRSFKEGAIREARIEARIRSGASVRIRTKDGRIQEERTYPRSRDPRRSRG